MVLADERRPPPGLQPEKADTWTVGVVIDSNFVNPWLSNLQVSIDYYSIEVTDAIGRQSGGLVMRQCLDPIFNPTFDVNSPYCDGMHRYPASGAIGQLMTSFFNNGEFETSGIDLSINWNMDAGPGRVGVNSVINYLIDKKSTELAGIDPLLDYTGTFGPDQNGLSTGGFGGGSYEWRALTEMSYTIEDLRVAFRWEFLDSIEQEDRRPRASVKYGRP